MAREELIRFRRGTRAELNASTANWKPGEPGYITDEGRFIIATLDAAANVNVFLEFGQYSSVQKSLIQAFGTVDPISFATCLKVYGTDDQLISFWTRDYDTGKKDIILPDANAVKRIDGNVFGFASPSGDLTFSVVSFPNLEKISHEGELGGYYLPFTKVRIHNNPKLTEIYLPGQGTGKSHTECFIYENPNLQSIKLPGNVDLTRLNLGMDITQHEAPVSLVEVDLTNCSSLDADDPNFELMVNDLPTHSSPGTGTFSVIGCTAVLGATNWTGGTNLKGQIEAKNWTVVDA